MLRFVNRHRPPLLGLAYVAVVLGLVAVSVQTYRKEMPWQGTVHVRLETAHPGLELNPHSDVKLQGLRVGEVRSITSNGTSAVVDLALDPSSTDLIPADVDAAIIPKTLFGEKFVDLLVPPGATEERISEGDVIRQSRTSTEIGDVYAKLVPVLQAIDPAELSVTLTSIADALDGRGRTFGETVTMLNRLLGEVNPHLGALQHDIRQFSRTAQVYSEAAPDILRTLAASTTITDDLLVPAEQRLAGLLDSITRTSDTAHQVLSENDDQLVTLAGRSRPVLELLDTYSTTLPCVLDALRVASNVANQTAGSRAPYILLTIDMFARQEPYRYPQDLVSSPGSDANPRNLPAVIRGWEPHCPRAAPWQVHLEDAPPGSLSPLPMQGYPPKGDDPGRTSRGSSGRSTSGTVGSPEDARRALALALAARMMHLRPADLPGYGALLVEPMLTDGEVQVR